jgi:predicted  nucleic acid-binding Zn-ribbon protein
MKELLEKLAKGESTVDDVLAAIENEKKDYIPRSRLNDKNEEIKDLKAEIKNRDDQISDLQKAVKGNEELENKLKDLEKANGDWEAKYKQTQIDTAVKLAAKDAKDPADVLAFINKDNLKLNDDGTITGLEEALKTLRESKSYLFAEEPKLGGRTPHPPGGQQQGITKEQFGKMTYQERVDLYNENPDLYQKLNS